MTPRLTWTAAGTVAGMAAVMLPSAYPSPAQLTIAFLIGALPVVLAAWRDGKDRP